MQNRIRKWGFRKLRKTTFKESNSILPKYDKARRGEVFRINTEGVGGVIRI